MSCDVFLEYIWWRTVCIVYHAFDLVGKPQYGVMVASQYLLTVLNA